MADAPLICMVEIPIKDLDHGRHSEPIGWSGRQTAVDEIADAQKRFRAAAP